MGTSEHEEKFSDDQDPWDLTRVLGLISGMASRPVVQCLHPHGESREGSLGNQVL